MIQPRGADAHAVAATTPVWAEMPLVYSLHS